MADINKMLEDIKGMTVLELSELVKAIEEAFGVTAAAPASAVAAPVAAAAVEVEEKTEFTVILKEAGATKMAVIKAVKEITGLGLVEAKAIVDGAPKTIKEAIAKSAADEIVKKLQDAGAVVEVK